MVGTGRIELPTSSVSRKRSPTELRACKTRADSPLRGPAFRIGFIIKIAASSRMVFGNVQVGLDPNSARDRFYYQFFEQVSTEPSDGRCPFLKPHEPSIEIMKPRENGGDCGYTDQEITNPGIEQHRIVQ